MKRVSLILCVLLLSLLVLVSCDSLGGKNEQTEPSATETPTEQVTEPKDTTPEVTEPEVTEPEATEPEVTEPEVTTPEVTEPEATEPEVTEPEATEPEVTEPEVTKPEATEPEVTEPEVTEPEVTEPEVTEPEVTEPGVQIPDTPPADEIPAWKDLTFRWYTMDMDEDGVLDMALYGYSPDGTVEGLVEDEEAIILSTVAYIYDNKGNLISEMVNDRLYDEKCEQVAVASYAIDWEGIYEVQYMAYSGKTPLGGWMAEKVTVDGKTALMVTVQLLSFHTVEHELLGTFYAPAEEIVIVYDESFENGYQAEKYVYDDEGNEISCDEIEINLRDMMCGDPEPMYRDTIDETIQPQKPVKPEESEPDDESYEEKTEYDEEGRPVRVQAYENGELISETTFTYMNGMLFKEFTVYYEEGISYMTDTTHYFYDKTGEIVDVDYFVNVPGEEYRTEYRYDKESGLFVAKDLFCGEELIESTLFEYDGSLLIRIEVVQYTAEGGEEVVDSIDYFYDEKGSYIGNSMEDVGTEEYPEDTKPSAPPVDDPEVTEPEMTEPEMTEPEMTEPEATEPEETKPEDTEPGIELPEDSWIDPEVTEPEEFVDGWYDIFNEKGDQTARRYYENGILYYEEFFRPGYGMDSVQWYDVTGEAVVSLPIKSGMKVVHGDSGFIAERTVFDENGNIAMYGQFVTKGCFLYQLIETVYEDGELNHYWYYDYGYDENGKMNYRNIYQEFPENDDPGVGSDTEKPEVTEPTEDTNPGIELPEDSWFDPVVTEPTVDPEPEMSEPSDDMMNGWYDESSEDGFRYEGYYENGRLYYRRVYHPKYGLYKFEWFDADRQLVYEMEYEESAFEIEEYDGFLIVATALSDGEMDVRWRYLYDGVRLGSVDEEVYGSENKLLYTVRYTYLYDDAGIMVDMEETKIPGEGSEPEDPEVPEDTYPIVTEPVEPEPEVTEPEGEIREGWHEGYVDGLYVRTYYENGKALYRETTDPDGNSGDKHIHIVEWMDRAENSVLTVVLPMFSADEFLHYEGGMLSMITYATSDGLLKCEVFFEYEYGLLKTFTQRTFSGTYYPTEERIETFIYKDGIIFGSEISEPDATGPAVTEPVETEPEDPWEETETDPVETKPGIELPDDTGVGTETPEDETGSNGLVYSLLGDGTYEVVGIGACKDSHIIIPSTYGGKPVSAIAPEAFIDCDTFTKITIPDSVVSIGFGAFQNCDELVEIIIPDSVKGMMDSVCFDCDSLTTVVIGSGIERIDYAFYDCDELISVRFSGESISIGSYAFYDCDALTGIVLPEKLSAILDSAFEDCDMLEEITIPDSVITIGNQAFYACYSLHTVTIGNGEMSISSKAFARCESLAILTIGHGVSYIGYQTFDNCYSLKLVYYVGTESEWANISISNGNEKLTAAKIVYIPMETEPEESDTEEPVESEPEDTWEEIETKPVESEPEEIEPVESESDVPVEPEDSESVETEPELPEDTGSDEPESSTNVERLWEFAAAMQEAGYVTKVDDAGRVLNGAFSRDYDGVTFSFEWVFEYDENGNMTAHGEKMVETVEGTETVIITAYAMEYDANGNCVKETVTVLLNGEIPVSSEIYQYQVDETGSIIGESYQSQFYTYEEDGSVYVEVVFDPDVSDNAYMLVEQYMTLGATDGQYDVKAYSYQVEGENKILQAYIEQIDGKTVREAYISYEEDMIDVQVENYHADGYVYSTVQYEYDYNGDPIGQIEHTYDANGKKLSKTDYIYIYTADGKVMIGEEHETAEGAWIVDPYEVSLTDEYLSRLPLWNEVFANGAQKPEAPVVPDDGSSETVTEGLENVTILVTGEFLAEGENDAFSQTVLVDGDRLLVEGQEAERGDEIFTFVQETILNPLAHVMSLVDEMTLDEKTGYYYHEDDIVYKISGIEGMDVTLTMIDATVELDANGNLYRLTCTMVQEGTYGDEVYFVMNQTWYLNQYGTTVIK